MADMPSDFWSGYIIVITAVSFIGLAWFVANVYFSGSDDHELEEQVWDHDLKEGTSAAPIWWFWLILSLMMISVIYLMLYPGLGSFSGVLRWSQGGEMETARTNYAADFDAARARVAASDVADLVADPAMVAAGGRIFRVHCAACHGLDGGGQADLFPDLRDDAWQWGESEAAIEQTIRSGRTAVMPPFLAALGEEGANELAEYVVALGDGSSDDGAHDSARTRYSQICIACHGPDATGNPLLGAPDLTSGSLLYGDSYEQVYESIASGRMGQMPAFGDKLDATQLKLLTAWLVAGPESEN